MDHTPGLRLMIGGSVLLPVARMMAVSGKRSWEPRGARRLGKPPWPTTMTADGAEALCQGEQFCTPRDHAARRDLMSWFEVPCAPPCQLDGRMSPRGSARRAPGIEPTSDACAGVRATVF